MEPEVYTKMYEREDFFWWHKGMNKIIDSILDKYFVNKSNNKILDIGCGTGGMFKTLSKYGQVFGIDKSEYAVNYARKRSIAQKVYLTYVLCVNNII